MPTIWDHDLWSDIYAIDDPETKTVFIRMYKLVLDMHNKDVMSEQIAHALKGERKLYLSLGQKAFAIITSLFVAVDAIAHLFHIHL